MTNDLTTTRESSGTSSPASSPSAPPKESNSGSSQFVERYALVGLLVLAFAVCAIFLPGFRSTGIIAAMVNSQSIILLLALAATVVLRTGDFDLAIPGIMVTSACVVAVLSTNGLSPAIVIPAALAVGLIAGLINALLVVRVGVDSFITTLGMFTALSGIGYAITGSKIVSGIPDFYVELSRAKLLGLPMTTWYGWVAVLVLWYLYQRTPMGRYMLFIGGNRDAAQLAGLPVAKIRTVTYVVSGLVGSTIGILLAGNLGAIDPGIGNQYLLAPFAAAFLGATAIAVGRFNALGTLVAVYLLVVGITGLQLMGAASWVSPLFNGLALMIAVTLAKLVGNRRGVSR